MIDERHEELASLYALDLLEGLERAQFETALARDPALQTLVRDLREASASLARVAPSTPPPAALRARVLASVGGAAPAAAGNVVRPPASVFVRFAPWAIAACFAFLAAWLAQRQATVQAEAALLRQQQALADTVLQSLRRQLEAERIVSSRQIAALDQQIVKLTDDMKTQGDLANLKIAALSSIVENMSALAVAVWDPARQEGVFALEKTPPLAADQKLELWVVETKPDAVPVSAGVLAVSTDGTARVRFKPTAPVSALKAFAISREKADGAAAHARPAEVLMLGAIR